MAWLSMSWLVSSAYSVCDRQNGIRLPPMTAMRLSEPSVMCRILSKMLESYSVVRDQSVGAVFAFGRVGTLAGGAGDRRRGLGGRFLLRGLPRRGFLRSRFLRRRLPVAGRFLL